MPVHLVLAGDCLMASKFKAQVYAFADLTGEALTRVVINALQEMMEYIQTSAPGVSTGGVLIEGRFPVASSALIRSLVTELDGSRAAQGENAYAVGLVNYQLGQMIRFAWTEPYALRIEMGFSGSDSLGRTFQQPGWMMVMGNIPKWPSLVEKHARIERVA